jgi:molybdenum cofactor cytidylyltransferase
VISAIILAAGTSSRFGRTKQLLELEDKPLVQHAIDAAVAAGVDEVVVILGHDADAVRAAIVVPPNGRVVGNPEYEQGQSTSVRAGLAACDPDSEGALVLLADQPRLAPEHLGLLIERFLEERRPVTRLRYRDGPGPALLAREVWGEVSALTGDAGAREFFAADPARLTEVSVDADAPPDVDLPGDEERL